MTKHQILYYKHKENGECTRCGRKLNEEEKKISLQCLSCRARSQVQRMDPKHKLKVKIYAAEKYKKNSEYQIKKVAERQNKKRELGICVDCALPVWKNLKRCRKHTFWRAADAKRRRDAKKSSNVN
jgi:hypothetical protein